MPVMINEFPAQNLKSQVCSTRSLIWIVSFEIQLGNRAGEVEKGSSSITSMLRIGNIYLCHKFCLPPTSNIKGHGFLFDILCSITTWSEKKIPGLKCMSNRHDSQDDMAHPYLFYIYHPPVT